MKLPPILIDRFTVTFREEGQVTCFPDTYILPELPSIGDVVIIEETYSGRVSERYFRVTSRRFRLKQGIVQITVEGPTAYTPG